MEKALGKRPKPETLESALQDSEECTLYGKNLFTFGILYGSRQEGNDVFERDWQLGEGLGTPDGKIRTF